jgi:hypothetical protein
MVTNDDGDDGCVLFVDLIVAVVVVVFVFVSVLSLSILNFCEYFKLFDVKARTNFSVSTFCFRACVDLRLDFIIVES